MLIISVEQPFTLVDDDRYEYFMETCVEPSWTRPSRNTVRNDCLKAFRLMKEALVDYFSTSSNILIVLISYM